MSTENQPRIFYIAPPAGQRQPGQLLAFASTPLERCFTFYERIEIGRYTTDRRSTPGILLIQDPTVSSRHCIITQSDDGRFFVRDVSRNGTRLDGRRLVPNVEVEIKIGQALQVGTLLKLVLVGAPAVPDQPVRQFQDESTLLRPDNTKATILVGDIRDYTVIVQQADSALLQRSLRRLFHELESEVLRQAGTIKEYLGDAIFAFWDEKTCDNHALAACRAALALDRLTRRMAASSTMWEVPNFPLRMDWALATGLVSISSIGGDRPTGLSMVGEAVVRAFRLEKLADESTGPILACASTQEMAADRLRFKYLGEKHTKGFAAAEKLFALIGEQNEDPA